MNAHKSPILVAIDTNDLDRAVSLAKALASDVAGVKLGLEFYMAQGAPGVAAIRSLGVPVFLDLKFHDIPNTVAGAMAAIAPLSPMLVNLHASGGNQSARMHLNAPLAKAYARELTKLSRQLNLKDGVTLDHLVRAPVFGQVKSKTAVIHASCPEGGILSRIV